jgi:hypothetical protein
MEDRLVIAAGIYARNIDRHEKLMDEEKIDRFSFEKSAKDALEYADTLLEMNSKHAPGTLKE